MGRSSNRKKNRKEIRPVPAVETKTTKSGISKIWSGISTFWKVIGLLFVVGGGVLSFVQLYDRFFPPEKLDEPIINKEPETVKERFKKDNIDTGYLQGPLIFSNYNPESFLPIKTDGISEDSLPKVKGILVKDIEKTGVKLKFGTNILTVSPQQLNKGTAVSSEFFTSGCEGYSMFFGVKNDRLYVSLKFRSFDNNSNLIGFIEFNKWKLFLDNVLDYDSDDKRLEVRDKPMGNIVFSLKYADFLEGGMPVVDVNGYFVTNIGVIVINDDRESQQCFNSDDISRQEALKCMRNTKSIF